MINEIKNKKKFAFFNWETGTYVLVCRYAQTQRKLSSIF